MIVGTPIWLWLVLAAVIPLLIHLWNKRSGKPRLLGTFRFLPEESFASAKRIELHEVPLMLIRMLMVVLVTLLLAGLFLKEEVEGVERLIISETSTAKSVTEVVEDGALSVSVSSAEIKQKGWWNVLEQIEYRQQPEKITIRGDLSEANFRGARPASNAVVDWEPVDSLYADKLILAVWEISEERYQALIQHRTDAGIQTFVEKIELSEIQNNEVEVVEEPRIIVNSENEEAVNIGLEFAAAGWGIKVEEQPIEELARLEFGERIFRLVYETEEQGAEDVVEANSTFGISLFVKEMRADVQPHKEIMVTQNAHIPFIYVDNNGSMIINGIVEKELQSWIYAGIAQQLMTEAFEVDEFLTPELSETQRDPAAITSRERGSNPTEQRSARLWLMGLLAFCWLAERWMAPGRGM
jgi:hypothetical protein